LTTAPTFVYVRTVLVVCVACAVLYCSDCCGGRRAVVTV
jgi:hypothetical protein